MIQEGLGIVWRRILKLKQLLFAAILINVLAATSGIICSIFMWKGTFDLSEKVVDLHSQQSRLHEVASLATSLDLLPHPGKVSREDAFKEMQSWERLRSEVKDLELKSAKHFPNDYFVSGERAKFWLSTVKQEIQSNLNQHESQIVQLAHREHQLTRAVIWLAAITLIFGVAIPMIAIALILKALRVAQRTLTTAAKEIVQDWSTALNRYGEEPFKNAQFWVEAVLILTEQFGSQSRHPAAVLGAELSHLVRHELHKSKSTAA
jgi:hypothetical protein